MTDTTTGHNLAWPAGACYCGGTDPVHRAAPVGLAGLFRELGDLYGPEVVLRRAFEVLNPDAPTMQAQVDAARAERDRANKRVDALEATRDQRLDAMTAEKARLQAEVDMARAQRDSARRRVAQLEATRHALDLSRELAERLRAERDALAASTGLDDLEAELVTLRRLVARLEALPRTPKAHR